MAKETKKAADSDAAASQQPLTVERIREMAEAGQVTLAEGTRTSEPVVKVAVLRPFKDNGKNYSTGDTCHMAITLVPRHVKAGVVELAT